MHFKIPPISPKIYWWQCLLKSVNTTKHKQSASLHSNSCSNFYFSLSSFPQNYFLPFLHMMKWNKLSFSRWFRFVDVFPLLLKRGVIKFLLWDRNSWNAQLLTFKPIFRQKQSLKKLNYANSRIIKGGTSRIYYKNVRYFWKGQSFECHHLWVVKWTLRSSSVRTEGKSESRLFC